MSLKLSLDKISCRTPERVLFQGLSLNITGKDKIAVFGANGAGKTTMLKAIVGLTSLCEGKILMNDEPLLTEKDFIKVRSKIGFLFQDPDDQFIAPTVIEEVAFGLLNMGMKQKDAVDKAESMLAEMNILHLRDRVTFNLSGGEKKMTALASVLVLNPELLLLDEPSSALDEKSEEKLISILKNIDKSVLIVSHDTSFIERVGAVKKILSSDGLF